jgi:Cu+-exporting ATPase
LSLAAGIERGSEHPLAEAVVQAARARGADPVSVDEITADPGRGIAGRWGTELVAVLGASAVEKSDLNLGPLAARAANLAREGKSWSVVLRGSAPAAILGFSDEIAPGVPEAVQALRDDGVEVVMLTGDHEQAAKAVAERAGISEVHAQMSPAEKLYWIQRLQSQGRFVAYVGDGINDAPALVQANLGIAIGAGADVAREAGGVILVRADFRGVALALRIGRRTVRKIRGNLAWATGYNAVLLPIAMGALVPFLGLSVFQVLPLTGALAMALSSTLVVLNSYSLRWTSIRDAG